MQKFPPTGTQSGTAGDNLYGSGQWGQPSVENSSNFMMPNSLNQIRPYVFAVRKGKWSEEEEQLTKKLISAFNEGFLRIASGTTLRTFLSEMLFW